MKTYYVDYTYHRFDDLISSKQRFEEKEEAMAFIQKMKETGDFTKLTLITYEDIV